MRSPMSRRCGSGGNSHSFWAMYSLKMSVCRVPSSLEMSAPWRSAATRYMQKMGTAGPEMVMLVVIEPRSMPSKRMSMSAAESIATPQQRGHVEGGRQASAAGGEEHPVALVGLAGVAAAGELPERPGATAVPGRVEPAGEGKLARPADPLEPRVVDPLRRPVRRIDPGAGEGGEVRVPLAGRVVAALPACPPRSEEHTSELQS